MVRIDRLMREMPFFKAEPIPLAELVAGQKGKYFDKGRGNRDLEIDFFIKELAAFFQELAHSQRAIAQYEIFIFCFMFQQKSNNLCDVLRMDEMKAGVHGEETDEPEPFLHFKDALRGM
jgi:hypothetical protein